jgi:hypothetical protein
LFGLVSAPVRAEVNRGNGEIGFDVGFTDFASKAGTAAAPRLAFRFGYQVSNLFQIEGQPASADTLESDESVKLTNAFINGVFNLHPSRNLVPYFLLGAGAARLDLDVADDSSEALQFAGGSRFFGTTGQFGLRAGIGWTWDDTFDETTSNWGLRLGLTWRLGADRNPAAPAKPYSYGRR